MRCMYHSFHPDTHRCRSCDRWQPGYAPAKKRVKPVAECQVCERVMATDKDGTLGHHGYQRPGWGTLVGDCFGEGHRPFPAVDALKKWLAAVEGRLVYLAKETARVADAQVLVYTHRDWHTKKETAYTVKAGDRGYYLGDGYSVPAFDALKVTLLKVLSNDVEHAERERARVAARILKGEALT